MPLTANVKRVYELGDWQDYPVLANAVIYEGAAVGDNGSGFSRPLVAGDPFLGFSDARVVNTGGSSGDKSVNVLQRGKAQLNITGAAITDVGKAVYASDDSTFTLTQGTNSAIGRIIRWVSTGVVIVAFDVTKAGFGGGVALLTDSSGGTASDTLPAISATYTQTEIRNSIASLAAKINFLLRQLAK